MARTSLKNIVKLIDSAKDELPIQEAFLTDLKRSIEMEDEQGRRLPSRTYKPSSMQCIRNMYYQRIGKETDDQNSSYVLVGICNAGTDIHLRTQRAVAHMKKFDFDCHYIDVAKYIHNHNLNNIEVVSQKGMETKLFNKKLNMSFMCDGIIKYHNHYYGLELKSESSFKWNARQGVALEHYNQATAYSISLDLPDWIFVYINRDIFDMKAYMFTPTSDMKHELVGMIDSCEGYVSRLVTPPKPKELDKKTCEYCNYRTLCRKEV